FLDLYCITLARLLVREPDLFSQFQRRQARFDPFYRRSRMFGTPSDEIDATVEFLRFTLDPTDAQLVVPLAAARTFDRFVEEHFGLAELLAEAFPDQW